MMHLETNRLVLRNFTDGDWKELQCIVLDFQASPYAAYDHPWPASDTEIQGICNWFATGDEYLAVCLKGQPEPVGYLALNKTENMSDYNLGYCFHSGAHGKGYASEACRAAIGHAFNECGAEKIVSGTAAANTPSLKLLKKLGFRVTGEHTGSFRCTAEGEPIVFTGYSFELTQEEWAANSRI